MSYYRIRFRTTVYTNEKVADEEQLEADLELSIESLIYDLFHGEAYNTDCEVERRMIE